MIRSYADETTESFHATGKSRKVPPDLRDRLMMKFQLLDAATTLDALRDPPGNHLEALFGDRTGQHSIRVNKQYRLCFVWNDDGPAQVEFADYH